MAIDPRISLAVRAPDVAPAINIFENALMNSQTRGLRSSQEARRAELAPFQLQQAQQQAQSGQATFDEQTENRILRSVADFGIKLKPVIQSGNIGQAQTMLANRVVELQSQGLPTDETVNAITALRGGDYQGVLNAIDSIQTIAQQRGLSGIAQTARQREFTGLTKGLSAEDKLKSARIELGLDPKASLTGQERIALNDKLGAKVVEQLEAEAGAKEGGKLVQQLKHKPAINKAVKLAEADAKERGEVLTDVARMEASLPGVKEVVNELVELSSIATSTFAGRLFDSAVKESGFGSTKGADAKAKLIAIVDNQVLPLLKETFGAAFTVQEGENLKASLVNPNASPSEKRAQLDAFIAQKERNLRTKQSQLDAGSNQPAPSQFSEGQTATGPNGEKIVFTNGQWGAS